MQWLILALLSWRFVSPLQLGIAVIGQETLGSHLNAASRCSYSFVLIAFHLVSIIGHHSFVSQPCQAFIWPQVTHNALMCRASLRGRVSEPISGQPDLKESTHSLSLTQQVLIRHQQVLRRDNPLFFGIGPFLAPRLTQHECLTVILQHDCLATRSQQDIENSIDVPPMHESTSVGSRCTQPCNNPTAGPSSQASIAKSGGFCR